MRKETRDKLMARVVIRVDQDAHTIVIPKGVTMFSEWTDGDRYVLESIGKVRWYHKFWHWLTGRPITVKGKVKRIK